MSMGSMRKGVALAPRPTRTKGSEFPIPPKKRDPWAMVGEWTRKGSSFPCTLMKRAMQGVALIAFIRRLEELAPSQSATIPASSFLFSLDSGPMRMSYHVLGGAKAVVWLACVLVIALFYFLSQ